ncbi:hypothetical protein PRK78_006336 [Emydomyces testavorans]|uniref:A-kinase anchor protein 7-like phosphoesterase domain-containing protein n=1 Tax=Emydomyces testavorans TaxID=2070801 RepID=A0AAF0DMB2_9EURO|nr:hypothetical protein PRK78_006336 [Emydomyces testavorans]
MSHKTSKFHSFARENNKFKGRQNESNAFTNKKPRLTHFLCFPLANETSATQLDDSLEEFKLRIPFISPPFAGRAEAAGHAARIPLVPDEAMRPLGTLHLTLGVMSLPTKERLREALDFLESLDLDAMLEEAEIQAGSASPTQSGTTAVVAQNGVVQPLIISLTSLGAFPNPHAATVLHMQPVDPTSRLYPFSVSLRNKFIEAGFMQCEMIKDPNSRRRTAGGTLSHGGGSNDSDEDVNSPFRRNAKSTGQVQDRLVPRPLLLHATIANTIYAKGGRTGGNHRKEIYKFDATELLDMFGNNSDSRTNHSQSYNQGERQQQQHALRSKAIPRAMAGFRERENFDEDNNNGNQLQIQRVTRREQFIWARDVLLDRLCICEMGAKPVPYDGGPDLVEEYTIVGEKRLCGDDDFYFID